VIVIVIVIVIVAVVNPVARFKGTEEFLAAFGNDAKFGGREFNREIDEWSKNTRLPLFFNARTHHRSPPWQAVRILLAPSAW